MKRYSTLFLGLSILLLNACQSKTTTQESKLPIEGTWKLLTGTIIEKGDTTITSYTENVSFIKIINGTHFAFLKHPLPNNTDSTATFDAGGGSYTLKDSTYTEHLEYYKLKEWENNKFEFTVTIKNDTLIQKGIEKVEKAGIERLNIEKYVRVK
ncbi:hypothetical protein Emtol_2435 [Emticicia oligotrophica DSM 17448]|uniref:Lipocalin-like domain-containing protein n=1 Tax=Emticicia oligotrophica (strain DSM 17448 / CIP 109782 / MTCC 6937 / GPTSA100-15) TaxID=929562 RepID=A0ABN4AN31_EMTOG|nr:MULTISPECIES: hypothetical protein [Emticicia]AFK03571.1 hypothetical protein Emtol_2435 [Emticicia oligotrophica DSM 17448]